MCFAFTFGIPEKWDLGPGTRDPEPMRGTREPGPSTWDLSHGTKDQGSVVGTRDPGPLRGTGT